MNRKHDWLNPLRFGDGLWIEKKDVEPLVNAIHKLLNNIYEFGAPTDSIFTEAVEDALIHLQEDKNSPSTLKPPICPNCGYMFTLPICTKCGYLFRG